MTRPVVKFETSDAAEAPAPLHILVVEDHSGCLLVTTSYLDLYGHTYDVARSGEEALHKATTSDYSLILTDVKMRDIDGLEVTRHIREFERENQKAAVPIIGLTAYALLGDRERCTTAGMNDYISKPVDYTSLESKIKSIARPSL